MDMSKGPMSLLQRSLVFLYSGKQPINIYSNGYHIPVQRIVQVEKVLPPFAFFSVVQKNKRNSKHHIRLGSADDRPYDGAV